MIRPCSSARYDVTMRVAFIAAECEPWAKTGGLGDVVDALARALPAAVPDASGWPVDQTVDVFLPRYRSVPVPPGNHPTIVVRVLDPSARGRFVDVRIMSIAANGYRLRLVDHPPAFDRDGLYDHPDDAWRFGLFCRAALEAMRVDAAAPGGVPVDVLHVHDWHAAPALLDRAGRLAGDPVIGRAGAVLTIHNLAYHGWVPRAALAQLGLRPGDRLVAPTAVGIDLLWDEIERAEVVNTVSPGYAAEALTPEFGFGLDPTLRAKGDRFVGILNGLDTSLWDPATDADLAARYSRADRSGKAACRADVLRRTGLDPSDPSPVLGMIGRLDPQKGFDLLVDAAPRLLAAGARLIVQGSGDPVIAAGLRVLARARPYEVAFIERFDRAMARRIYAGVDAYLMPSRFEPCGQGQMIALRYGTPPIVHATGGLRDSVIDEHDNPGHGTGFAFRHPTVEGLVWAVREALASIEAAEPGPLGWDALVDRGMAVDFDWVTGSAPRYLTEYRRAIELRRVPPAIPSRLFSAISAAVPALRSAAARRTLPSVPGRSARAGGSAAEVPSVRSAEPGPSLPSVPGQAAAAGGDAAAGESAGAGESAVGGGVGAAGRAPKAPRTPRV
jgi:starch synthase